MRVSCSTLDFAVPIITCTRKTRAASAWKTRRRKLKLWRVSHVTLKTGRCLGKKKKNCLIWYRQIRFILQAEPGSNSSRHPAKDDMRPAGNWNLVAEPWCGVWLYSCQSQSGVDIFPPPEYTAQSDQTVATAVLMQISQTSAWLADSSSCFSSCYRRSVKGQWLFRRSTETEQNFN